MTDFFGQELKVGDIVAFNPPVYKGLVVGRILKFTPKGCRVQYRSTGKQYGDETIVFQVFKAPESYASSLTPNELANL